MHEFQIPISKQSRLVRYRGRHSYARINSSWVVFIEAKIYWRATAYIARVARRARYWCRWSGAATSRSKLPHRSRYAALPSRPTYERQWGPVHVFFNFAKLQEFVYSLIAGDFWIRPERFLDTTRPAHEMFTTASLVLTSHDLVFLLRSAVLESVPKYFSIQ